MHKQSWLNRQPNETSNWVSVRKLKAVSFEFQFAVQYVWVWLSTRNTTKANRVQTISILLKRFEPTSEKWAPKQNQALKVEDNLVPTT
jgi:hypothetical protein